MVKLATLRLEIGPVERGKSRGCKITLDEKIDGRTAGFHGGERLSEIALPAHGAALRYRFLGEERIINLDSWVGGLCNVALKTLMTSRVN
jgi:hypothetical protein